MMFSLGSPPRIFGPSCPPPLLTLQHKLFLRCWWWYSLSFTPLSSPVAANNNEKQQNEQHPHKRSNTNDDLDPQHGNKPKNIKKRFRFAKSIHSFRSGLLAVDAIAMLQVRSGSSVDAIPQQRFAPTQ